MVSQEWEYVQDPEHFLKEGRQIDWAENVLPGSPVGVEVATPAHVEACLEYGIDVVWIGARTTPHPFAVQALADAMRAADMRVFVKNPISPDLELWIDALERLHGAGLRRLGVIHRGFRPL